MARVFSGIQPSGELHIGNWLGMVRSAVALQDQYECLYCVVDQHAITGGYDPGTLAERTRQMAIGLMAAGIDPSRSILYVQSHVPAHATLSWLLMSITPLGELERMTQYKDKAQRFESVPTGLLTYPVLMAADILLYRADRVPVGEDQVQHLELSREIARKWNTEFSPGAPYFPEPQAILSGGQADRRSRWSGQDVEEPRQHHRRDRESGADLGETPPGDDRPGAQDEEGPRARRRSATSTRCTGTSRRRRPWPKWPSSAARRGGGASSASGCSPTT